MWMDIAQEGEPEPRSDEEDTVYDRTNPFSKSRTRNPFEGGDSEGQVMLDEQDTRCGIFSWRPQYFQRFGNKTVFSVIFTIVGIFHGSFWTYYTANISTYEKRFRMDSTTSGVLLFGNELAQILAAVIFTYFGFRRHRAKVITLGVALSSLSCFLMASPHYFLGRGEMTSILVKGGATTPAVHHQTEMAPQKYLAMDEDSTTYLSSIIADLSFPTTDNGFKTSVAEGNTGEGSGTGTTNSLPDAVNNASVASVSLSTLPSSSSEGVSSSTSVRTSATSEAVKETSKEAKHEEEETTPKIFPIPYLNDEMGTIWPMCNRLTEDINATNKTLKDCETKKLERNVTFSLMFIANFIGGVAFMLYLLSGGPFMEDSTVMPNELARIFGITMAVRLIGTFFGYLFAWSCLTEYVNPTTDVTQIDSRWLGAYWLGWTCLGIFMAISAFIFALFPRQCPREFLKKRSLTHETGMSMLLIPGIMAFFGGAELKTANLFPSVLNIPNVVNGLLRNKIYILLTCSTMVHIFVGVGYFAFLPKYLEYMFRLKVADAAILTGISSVPCQVAGIMLGGAFISRYLPNSKEISHWNVIVTSLQIVGLMVMAFLGCSTEKIDVSFLQYKSASHPASSEIDNITSAALTMLPPGQKSDHCSGDCDCKTGPILPVCDLYTGTSYYSPCHAGCEKIENQTRFSECSCLKFENVTLTEGFCPSDNCSNGLIAFLVFVCLIQFLNGTRVVGKMLLSYKSLQADQRASIIGFTLIVMSILSIIPSPIVFGSLFESACVVREEMCNEMKGNCWLYKDSTLRFVYNLGAAAFLILAFILDAFLWKSCSLHDLRIYDGELRQLTQPEAAGSSSGSRSFTTVPLTT